MFREYQDTRIKRNFKYAKVLSLIALILWGVCTFTYLFTKWYPYDWMLSHPKDLSWSYMNHFWGGEGFWRGILKPFNATSVSDQFIWDFIYCLWYFNFAFLTYSFSRTALRKPATAKQPNKDADASAKVTKKQSKIKQWGEKYFAESKRNNDFTNIRLCIIFTFMPVAVGILLLLSVIIASMAGTLGDISDGVSSVAYHLGYMILPHIFLIVSSGFLIQNCVLIKREWKTNPPPFLLEQQQEVQRQKTEQDIETCKTLHKQCGMQFFIEYYPQLKRLPIPDIDVSDHYFPEREVRLPAAKKIVDSGLTECALRYIIETYGDVLSSEVIERAKTLLDEIKNEKGEIK